MADEKYPDTYSAELMCVFAGYSKGKTKICRSDATGIISMLAAIIGIDSYELSCKLADYYLLNQVKIVEFSSVESIT